MLRDPSARQAAPTSSLGPHLSPVNLQQRFEPATESVASQERLAGFVPGEESFCSPGSGGKDQSAVEGGGQTLGDRQAPWEDVQVVGTVEGSLPDSTEREAQDGDGKDGSKAGCASSLRTEANAVETEIGRGSEGQQSRDEQSSNEAESIREAGEIEKAAAMLRLDTGDGMPPVEEVARMVEEGADEGPALEEERVGRKEPVLRVSVDGETEANGGEAPGGAHGERSTSSGGDSSGSQVERQLVTGRQDQNGGAQVQPGLSSPSPDRTPGNRRGGIPRSSSNTNLRTSGRRGGDWDHRRRSSFGEGLLGRNPHEQNWRGPGGSPGPSFEPCSPSPDFGWQQMGPPRDFYPSPGGHFPEPYFAYASSPEVVYMPYQGFVMPSFPGSPGWGMEAPQFMGSPGPVPVPVPVPVPYLDRTNSDGALVHGPANGFGPPSPGQKLTRRASLGNRSTALRSPGPAAGGRGQGSPEHQIRSELQLRNLACIA